jgi:hypothetical protein
MNDFYSGIFKIMLTTVFSNTALLLLQAAEVKDTDDIYIHWLVCPTLFEMVFKKQVYYGYETSCYVIFDYIHLPYHLVWRLYYL